MLRLKSALVCAFHGIRAALATEAAFRQEVGAALVFAAVALVLEVSAAERTLLIAGIMLVLIVELLNSAVETTLDRISTDYNEQTRRAKDMGSAAVFLSIMTAAAIWLIILVPRWW